MTTTATRARVVGLGSPPGWNWSIEHRALARIGAELDVRECRSDADVADALSAADVVMSHHTVPITNDVLGPSLSAAQGSTTSMWTPPQAAESPWRTSPTTARKRCPIMLLHYCSR